MTQPDPQPYSPPYSPPPVPERGPEPAPGDPEIGRDVEWQRLDPRMLLVHPVRELMRFLPFVVGAFIAGTAGGSGGPPWQLLGVAVPVALGLLRYLTTTFRVHAGRVELRRGLLNKHVLSTPIDRVRTVDLTASPIHRVLGLTTIRVGTGTASTRDDDRLDLDGLPTARAQELRAELLRVAPSDETARDGETGVPGVPGVPGVAGAAVPVPAEEPVVRFTVSWLRFAPFTSAGLVIAGATLGVGSQLADNLGLFRRVDPGSIVEGRHAPAAVLVPLTVLGLLALVSLFAVLGYLVTNWGFRLTRTSGIGGVGGSAWHVRRGLLTTRETTLDVDRVAGVVLGEPVGLRLAGGRRLSAIVTGLGEERQGGSLTPPAPRDVVLRAAVEVLGTTAPMTGPLVPHGPRATRRRWTRALVPAVVVSLAAAVAVAFGTPGWTLIALLVLPVATALAADRARTLGHALVDGYLVARAGSLTRRRSALAVEHVIGWNLRATYWQRRAGLTTLVATTAGGGQRVVVPDIPDELAVALAERALPDLVSQFRT